MWVSGNLQQHFGNEKINDGDYAFGVGCNHGPVPKENE